MTIFSVITMGISRLIEASFDGIECYLAKRALRKHAQRKKYRSVALGPNRERGFREEGATYAMRKLSVAGDRTGMQH